MALICATVGLALGQCEATTFSVKHSNGAEGKSTGLKFLIEFTSPGAATGVPSGLKSFKIKLHKERSSTAAAHHSAR